MNKYILPIVLLSLLVSGATQAPTSADTETFDSMRGLEYSVTFENETNVLTLKIENDKHRSLNTTYGVDVDNWPYTQKSIELSPGERYVRTFNVTNGFDVRQDTHSVTVSTYEGLANFSFERNYSTLDPDGYPVPEITNVRVGTGMSRGNESTIIYVTVKNPSEHVYASYVVAHTEETTASTKIANPLPGTTETVELEVYEPIGSTVSGEIRMFMGKPNESAGALEQVEFQGAAEGNTSYEQEVYQPFEPPWVENGYEYRAGDGSWIQEVTDGNRMWGPVAFAGFVVCLGGFYWRSR